MLFSMVAFSAAPVPLTYNTDGNGLQYKRERFAFYHNEDDKVVVVHYREWVETSNGTLIGEKKKLDYQLDGSYYYELTLASTGATTLDVFLSSLIDARLSNTTIHVQDAIEAGRSQKNADMIALGWTP